MDIKFNHILYTKNKVREGVRKGMLGVFKPFTYFNISRSKVSS